MKLKKSAIVLSMILLMTMFTFVGCGNNDRNDMTDNGTTVEESTGNIVDDAEQGMEDLGNDIEDGAEDIVDDTEDMLDGNDANNNDMNDTNNNDRNNNDNVNN